MRKTFTLLMVLVLCLIASAALAQTEAEFNRSCWVKTNSATTLYRMLESGAGAEGEDAPTPENPFEACGTLSAGTYLQITASLDSYAMDRVSYWGGSGYIASSVIVPAVATVYLDDGSNEQVSEALAADPAALLAYLNASYSGKTFSYQEGSSLIHVSTGSEGSTSEGGSAAPVRVAPAPIGAPVITHHTADGSDMTVELVQLGTACSVIRRGDAEGLVPTASLSWESDAKKGLVLAMVNAPKTGTCTLFAEAKKTAYQLCKITTGTVVAVLKRGTNFTRVYVNGKVGFIKTGVLSFLTNDYSGDVQEGYLAYHRNIKSKNEINVRSSGKNGARIVGTYPSGTPIVILNTDNVWTEIQVGSLHCYVLTEFVLPSEDAFADFAPEQEMPAEDDAGDV